MPEHVFYGQTCNEPDISVGNCSSRTNAHDLSVATARPRNTGRIETTSCVILFYRKLVPIQRRLSKASKAVEYFTTREWHFRNDNFVRLNKVLSPQDRKRFCFDVRTIEWSSYLENYVLGIRKHIFGEQDCTIPKARQMLIW